MKTKKKTKKSAVKLHKKHVPSEFAIGMILLIALIMGFLIWLTNMKFLGGGIKQYTSVSMQCANIEASKEGTAVFLGDSLTALFDWSNSFDEPCVINAGISGNTTDDVVARLSAVLVSKPQKLFLMIGINDLLRGQNPQHVLENDKIILDQIRKESPQTKIYLQSLLPINNDILKSETASTEEILIINEGLKSLSAQSGAIFVDLHPFFCGQDNKMYKKYAGDGLHLSSVGYGVWKRVIDQYLK